MADQARWFKFWCSAPSDDDLLALPLELRWAWVVLGAYTKQHGTRGRVKLSASNVVLAAQMGVSALSLQDTCRLLPHLRVDSGFSDNGTFTVTWENWPKYQEDTTGYERVKRLRSKKRIEERRKEVPPKPPTADDVSSLISDTAKALTANGHDPDFEAKKAAAKAMVPEAIKRAQAAKTPEEPSPF